MNELISIRQTLFNRYYKALNEKQREAVFSVKGPLLVVAGAGSGKTTVLVNRISHIIKFGNAYYSEKLPETVPSELDLLREIASDESVSQKEILTPILSCFTDGACPPDRILAITFTNKAAGEIKERLKKELGDVAGEIWAGTFHSVCVRLLRRFSAYTRFSESFIIYDQDDCKKIITSILKDKEIDDEEITPRYMLNLISRAKNAMQDADTFAEINQGSEKRRICAEIYSAYQEELDKANAADFDDLILECVRMIQSNNEVRSWCNQKFQYILVDEYQDTNHAQSLLLKLITGEKDLPNLMAVGDDDQSIYKFRGAAVENILTFDKSYPGTKIVFLEQNYRSTRSILDAANALIAHNDTRRGKVLWCANGTGKKVAVRQLEDQEKEALYIADKIGFLTMQSLYRYKDFAILYRTKAQSNILETVFTKSGIPHRLLSGVRFYEHTEVKDVIAYLRYIANPRDTISLSRIINVPKRSIGQATLQKILSIANKEDLSPFDILSNAGKWEELKRYETKLSSFAELISSLRSFAESHLPSRLLQEILDQTGYMETLSGEENEERRKNVEELFSSARYYEDRSESPDLAGFLEELALVSDVDNYDENANAVVLMTVHAAKGLEFPVVFIAGMEENIFPSPHAAGNEADLEEERRLAYVAMTRAKQELFITCTLSRLLYGRISRNDVSRFVREIPEKLLDVEWCRTVPSYTMQRDDFFLPPRTSQARGTGTMTKAPVTPQAKKPSIGLQPKTTVRERFTSGDRVSHAMFGDGVILGAKDYGGDTLYEIRFESGETKKIMASYAKLTRKQ